MPDPILSIRGMSSGYGDFQALYDIDLDLNAKSILALVGANGAGKSTLFKSILGLLPREKHMVRFKGEAVGHLPTEAFATLGIALVPEGRRLFRSLSVEENLCITADFGRQGHWTIDRVMQLFPILGEKRKDPATSLSGGQQQMVAIGRALVANPEVIFFDELSLGLAPIVVNDVYKAMPDIIASGISGILVEQDVARARALADDLICMREGRIVLRGHPKDISQHDLTVAYFGEQK